MKTIFKKELTIQAPGEIGIYRGEALNVVHNFDIQIHLEEIIDLTN